MKAQISSPLLAANLLALSVGLNAQTTITPSGVAIDGSWSGYYIRGVEPASGVSDVVWNAAFPAGGVISETAAFYSSNPDYILDPAWGGTFGITATLNSGNLQYEHLLVRNPANANIGLAQNYLGDLFSTTAVVLRSRTGATTGSITYDFDFSGMEHGYLPSGSSLYLIDLDYSPATNEGPLTITAPAFSTQFLDYIGQTGSGGNPLPALPVVTWNSATGTYQFTQGVGGSGGLVDYSIFVTTQDITSLSISSNQTGGSHGVFFAAPVIPVPEPSGILMLGLSSVALLFNRRRER